MLKIVRTPTFTHDVLAHVPVDGGFREDRFKATFNVIPVDELAAYNMNTEKGTRDFLLRAVARLDQLIDESDRPIPYSDAVRDQALALPYVRSALARAYFEAVSKARSGN